MNNFESARVADLIDYDPNKIGPCIERSPVGQRKSVEPSDKITNLDPKIEEDARLSPNL